MTEDSYSGQTSEPLSLNLYSYCEDNPINFGDPTGNGKAAIFGKNMKKDINGIPQLASLIVGFTPADGAKDIADLIVGKDIFSQERTNRGILLICVFTPEIADKALKSGSKMVLGGGVETTMLYRVMSEGEYNSLNNVGKFTPYDKAMETKWLATNKTDAAEWGKLFYPDGNYKMVEIQVPTSALDDFYYVQKLDNIGPAYNAEMDFINSIMKAFEEVFK